MKHKLHYNKELYLILGLFFLLLGCEAKSDIELETGISSFSHQNPDGDILAILVGLKVKGWDRPAASETKPVLLKLKDNYSLESYQQLDDWVIGGMVWHPADDNQLYYVTFEKVFGSGGTSYEQSSGKFFKRGIGKLLMLDTNSSNGVISTISHNSYPNILSCFRWSPDGNILAGLAIKPGSQFIGSGELTVSFDGGKTSILTGIEMSGSPAWLNDKELFLRNDNTIIKASLYGQSFKVTETIANDFDIILVGSFHEKPVYIAFPRKDKKGESLDKLRRLFVGDGLIYETDDPYFPVFVFTDNIVVETEKKVIIFDENFSLCHERRLDQGMHLLNFQPKTNTIFLAKDWKTILCYDYTSKEKASVMFSVDMLNGRN